VKDKSAPCTVSDSYTQVSSMLLAIAQVPFVLHCYTLHYFVPGFA